MNPTRILRLSREKREQYIREEAEKMSHRTLRHYVAQYGVRGTASMSKAVLIDCLVEGLLSWANTEVLQ